jgi:glycosyltransferase involved in cell wall biosynthesis
MIPSEPTIRVVNLLPDPRVGGPQHRVAQLARRMRQLGIETTVLIPPGPAMEFFRRHEVPCVPFDFPRLRQARLIATAARTGLGLFLDAHRLAKVMRSVRASILHCNGLLTLIGPLSARSGQVKMLWHLNDTLVPTVGYRTVLGAFKGLVDRVVFSSRAVADHARYRGNFDVVYPPVDLDRFANVGRGDKSVIAEHGLDPALPTLVSVGNVNRSKGYVHLVSALGLLSKRNLRLQALIVGVPVDSKLSESLLRTVHELGLQDSVRFVGGKTDVERYYRAAAAFVLPSVSEAMPMALLEAMACGVPCVATRVGGVEEVLHDGVNGILVEPAHSQALAAAIPRLVLSPEAASDMGKRASREVAERCSLERIAQQQAAIYREMMAPTSAVA